MSWLQSLLLCLIALASKPLLGACESSPPPGGAVHLPVLVPDLSEVGDGATLKTWHSDKFLSLWQLFVLAGAQRDQVLVAADEPWTLLLPRNEGLPRQDRSFLVDADHTRRILLNHVILGDVIDPNGEMSAPYYSLADSELSFTKGPKGEVYVNGIRLTGETLRTKNGVVYVIEESLPLVQPEFVNFVRLIEGKNPPSPDTLPSESDSRDNTALEAPLDNSQGVASTESRGTLNNSPTTPKSSLQEPRPTRFEKFRKSLPQTTRKPPQSPSSTTKTPTTTTTTSTTTTTTTTTELPTTTKPDPMTFGEFAEESVPRPPNSTFVSSMTSLLDSPESLGAEFLHHFVDANLQEYLSSAKNYTGIIPTNDAFYDYYPIDWGFNPFLVQNFTKDVLLNHILEGDIQLQSFEDPVEIHTVEDRVIQVIKNKEGTVIVNGEVLPLETEVEVASGRLYFINKLLFVDYDRVNALREEYPFLETAPLLSYPWPSSPFLSHLLQRLQSNQETKIFAHLLRNSNIAHKVLSSDENLNRLTYSVFVPLDDSLRNSINQHEDLSALDPEAINDFLLAHITPGYLLEEDFEDGYNLLSLTNDVLPITITKGKIFVGSSPSRVRTPEEYIYNLGALFTVDEPLKKLLTSKSSVPNSIPLPAETKEENAHASNAETFSPASGLVEKNMVRAEEAPTTTAEPRIAYEVRTEISFSRQINDGEIVAVSKDVIDRAKSFF